MITRNNYEEFFLLYVDNELSPADRQAVERFVDEHPDLKEEWELLLQCRISPDEMPSFSGKEELLRSEALSLTNTPIHANNYEEWFLSYIDDELPPASRQAVIDFVRQHPEKNIELQQLQRTVNTPDPNIVFPNKELLYREEGAPTRKIAWLPFARIAAAALILGAVGLLIFRSGKLTNIASAGSTDSGHIASASGSAIASAPDNGTASASGAATVSPTQQSASNPGAATASGTQQSASDSPATAPTAAPATTSGKPASAPVLASAAPSNEKKRTAPVTPRNVDPYYIQKTGDKQSTPTRDETVAPVLAQVDPARSTKVDPVSTAKTVSTDPGHEVAVVIPKTIDRNAKIPVTMAAAGDQTQHDATGNTNASFATQALLSQVSYSDDGYQEETASPRKNKLRGIFRKVTRVLEKPAARVDDDNKKVTIGGFQFASN